jgi:hypothetical protein
LAGFPTTTTTDDAQNMEKRAVRGKKWGFGTALSLGTAVRLVGFPTTTTRDSKSEGKDGPNRTGSPSLPAVALGVILDLFFVPTGRRVVLAPEFSLWLMGYPEAWVTAAPGAKDWREAQAALELECSREAGTR